MLTFIEQKFEKSASIKEQSAFEKRAISINPYAQRIVKVEQDATTIRYYFVVPSAQEVKEFKG